MPRIEQVCDFDTLTVHSYQGEILTASTPLGGHTIDFTARLTPTVSTEPQIVDITVTHQPPLKLDPSSLHSHLYRLIHRALLLHP